MALLNSGFGIKDQALFAEEFYNICGDSLGLQRGVKSIEIDFDKIDDNGQNNNDDSEEINLNDEPKEVDEAQFTETVGDDEL